MRVFLIGYKGCGKSTVSKVLSERLLIPYYSFDQEIEKQEAKSISEIIEEKGWDFFRNRESSLLEKFSKTKGVFDCGEGIIELKKNRDIFQKEEWVFFLKADVKILKGRLSDKKDRPLLSPSKDYFIEMEEVYKRRLPLYEQCSKFIVDANQNIEDVVNTINFYIDKVYS